MRIIKLILIVAFMVIGAAFAKLNAEPVSLNYYFAVAEVPLALILMAAVLLGALLGVVVSLGRMVRMRHELAELRRKQSLTQQELENLRALPIKE